MTPREKRDAYLKTVWFSSNGKIDLDRYINSDYGRELIRRVDVRTEIEDSYEKAEKFYASIGLSVEVFEDTAFYTRWKLFTPLNAGNEPMPLIFYLHGGGISIEGEEYACGFLDLAAKEKFCVCVPQNTNWDNVSRLIDKICEIRNIDGTRIYVGGFSQGSTQTYSCMYRLADKIAACYMFCGELYNPRDPREQPYTKEETDRIRTLGMPLTMLCGGAEPSCYAPLNDWHPRVTPRPETRESMGIIDSFEHPGRHTEQDPTRIYDPQNPGKWRMPAKYEPKDGEDPHYFGISKLNARLDAMNIPQRDADRCVSFALLPEDDIHRITGAYSDREYVKEYYGVKHYTLEFDDINGENTLRYTVVDNAPHFPPMAGAQIAWEFLKQFKRDAQTKKSTRV